MPIDLRVPNNIAADPDAREILRVWASRGDQTFALRPDVWDDPAAWGILLVDVARHVAAGLAAKSGADEQATLARIREGFDVEWEAPTDA